MDEGISPTVLEAITAERRRQRAKYSEDHDGHHLAWDWTDFIEERTGEIRRKYSLGILGPVEWKRLMTEVATLAVAALESFEREEKAYQAIRAPYKEG